MTYKKFVFENGYARRVVVYAQSESDALKVANQKLFGCIFFADGPPILIDVCEATDTIDLNSPIPTIVSIPANADLFFEKSNNAITNCKDDLSKVVAANSKRT